MTPSSSHDYLTNAAACASFDALTGAARRAPTAMERWQHDPVRVNIYFNGTGARSPPQRGVLITSDQILRGWSDMFANSTCPPLRQDASW